MLSGVADAPCARAASGAAARPNARRAPSTQAWWRICVLPIMGASSAWFVRARPAAGVPVPVYRAVFDLLRLLVKRLQAQSVAIVPVACLNGGEVSGAKASLDLLSRYD